MIKAILKYLKRFKNVGTVVGVASATIFLLTTIGLQVNDTKVMAIVKAACALGVILGFMNNPETPGLDIPRKSKIK